MDDPQELSIDENDFDENYEKNFILAREGSIVYLKFKPNTLYSFPLQKFKNADLTYLSLPNNHIKELDVEIFSSFPNLNWLDVRDNRLLSFPRYVNHKKLEQILLGGNKIQKLPIELGSFENLCALQIAGNPLTFPDLKVLAGANYNLVEFLKLCWKNQTKNPLSKNKPQTDGKKQARPVVKKEDCIAPVKPYKSVANIVAEKMNSSDPVDQILASKVLKKLRSIQLNLKKMKDQTALKEWREKYNQKSPNMKNEQLVIPFGIDADCMNMISRNELNESRISNSQEKKVINRQAKKYVNINEELKRIDLELNTLRNRPPALDASQEKALRLLDIQKMNNIQKKIHELQLVNTRE